MRGRRTASRLNQDLLPARPIGCALERGGIGFELIGGMTEFRRNIRGAVGETAQLDRGKTQKTDRIIYRA
jgi:hypothetical protein